MTKNITQAEIDTEKARIHSLGIAHFSINGLDEDTSIKKALEEKWSYFYVAALDPYTRGKHKRFRVFQTSKAEPSIPMGYYGSPTFSFECFDGEPMKKAIETLKPMLKKAYSFKIDDNHLTLVPVLSDDEKAQKEAVKVAEVDKYAIKETDSASVKAIKADIAKLEKTGRVMRDVNKAIRKYEKDGQEAQIKAIMAVDTMFTRDKAGEILKPDFCNRIGFAGYQMTSVSTKIKRLKAKLA